MADLGPSVEAGPDPVRDGVVRWRRQDLQRRIAEAFGVEMHERRVGKYLAALGLRRLQVAPAAPGSPPGQALNPVENVWQYLRANWLAISVFDSTDAIVEARCTAWNRFANDPNTVTSITTRSWAQVN